MTRNGLSSETELIDAALESIARRLPGGWKIQSRRLSAARSRPAPDAVFELRAPSGERARIAVEAKATLSTKQVRAVLERMQRDGGDAWLVTAPFIGAGARQMLREARCGYSDPTGNLWLSIARPGLFIETAGAQKSPVSVESPLRSLRGRSAGRAVRALCDFTPPFGVRELSKRAGVSAPTLSRVIALLDREALVERSDAGVVVRLDWEKAIRRWAQDYSFAKSNHTRLYLDPRGLPSFRRKLATAKWRYAVTGSLAASVVAPIAAPRLAQVYAEDFKRAVSELELRATDTGANVMLAEPYDCVVFDRTARRDGLVCACLSQVAADLLTSPGRAPAEADALFKWMAENLDEWRR